MSRTVQSVKGVLSSTIAPVSCSTVTFGEASVHGLLRARQDAVVLESAVVLPVSSALTFAHAGAVVSVTTFAGFAGAVAVTARAFGVLAGSVVFWLSGEFFVV